MSTVEDTIFRKGSTTYYWGARFFPKAVRADVLKLYSFLRVADDYVDSMPAQGKKFRALRRAWEQATRDAHFQTAPTPEDSIDQRVIKNIVAVSKKYNFERAWLEAFWDSMQADLEGRQYQTLKDSLWYVYGSADVVGLMMAKVMGVPSSANEPAMALGRAMQWINFIRDLAEDNTLGRSYFPRADLRKFGLPDLAETTARAHPQAFQKFMRFQIARYRSWRTSAFTGQKSIPRACRAALSAAADMYDWTADEIDRDPLVVFERKVKPKKGRIIRRGLRHLVVRG